MEDVSQARKALLVIGPVDQDLVNVAWEQFHQLLIDLADRNTEWLLCTSRNWSVRGSDRLVSGDPAKWRIATPRLTKGFKHAGQHVWLGYDAFSGFSVLVQTWRLNHLSVVTFGQSNFSELNSVRMSLPLTPHHWWYLFESTSLDLFSDTKPDVRRIHSFGQGTDPGDAHINDGKPAFAHAFVSSLTWQLSR